MQKKLPAFKTAGSYNLNQLSSLYAQMAEYQKFKQKVCVALPESIAQQVLHCTIKNKTLIIFTTASVWSSQIRFYQSALLASLNQGSIKQADSLQVKVIVMQTGVSPSKISPATIPSADTISIIQKQVETLSGDALKKSFQHLIQTLKNVRLNKTKQPI